MSEAFEKSARPRLRALIGRCPGSGLGFVVCATTAIRLSVIKVKSEFSRAMRGSTCNAV
jgi:hypothetical protein